jgi:hypothetical protein
MSNVIQFAVLAAVLLHSPSGGAASGCEPVNGIDSVCGLQAPEDLVVTPDEKILFGEMAAGRGISLLDPHSLAVTVLYQPSDQKAETGWGAPACATGPGAEVLIHGIDLSLRADGRWQLLAVNHGGRESVEFFEFLPGQEPQLHWRGCVIAPADASFNDVAALPGQGFVVSHMYPRDSAGSGFFKALLGFDTGHVYRWTPAAGFEVLPGTEAPFPNGIVVSADGEHLYMNSWAGGEVRKYSLVNSSLVASAEISSPDNSSWTSDGRLLVASHRYSWTNILSGFPNEDGSPATMPFAIVELDPQTMNSATLVELEGPPMGAGTVAVELAGYLFIGSYTGDRIIRVPVGN